MLHDVNKTPLLFMDINDVSLLQYIYSVIFSSLQSILLHHWELSGHHVHQHLIIDSSLLVNLFKDEIGKMVQFYLPPTILILLRRLTGL